MKYILAFLLTAGAVLFSGCTTTAEKNVENSKLLRVGMTKSRVLEIMGEPLTEEEYNTPDVWYYYVETVWLDGLTTRDECMPVVFENGKLAGWGNRFYTQYRSSGIRNAREIKLTGDLAEKAQEAPQTVKAPETAPAVKADAVKSEEKKAAPEPAVAPRKSSGKKAVTVDDLVTEMDAKK